MSEMYFVVAGMRSVNSWQGGNAEGLGRYFGFVAGIIGTVLSWTVETAWLCTTFSIISPALIFSGVIEI